MNRDLQALMKKRRKQMGLQEQQPQKPHPKVQTKTQKSSNEAFSQAKKHLEANLFKQNLPKQAPSKPKEQIKGNPDAIKNAKALLEAQLNFGNSPTIVNTGGNLPPPPTLNIPVGGLPPPPTLPNIGFLPPPPTLPNIANLPPPPSLPNLPPPPKIGNLPPPPTLPNLPHPPTLPNISNLPPPLTLPNLPPPPTISNNNPTNTGAQKVSNLPLPPNNLPPPPNNLPPPPKNLPPPPNYLPPPPVMNTPTQPQGQKITKTESIQQSNRNSSKISEQQFRAYQNTVKKQSSVDKKKSIFNNEPIRSSNKQPPIEVNPYQTKPNTNPQGPQPIVLPSNNSKYQEDKKPQNTNLPPKSNESKQKKRIFQKENSISLEFFGKDVAGFLKRQFLKSNDVISYIDKKLPLPKYSIVPKYTFPSILQQRRGGKDQLPDPRQMIYVDTKVLNVSGPFLVNNLNAIRDHNLSRQSFQKKLKTYDIAKDPQKIQLKATRQLVQTVPSIQCNQLNLARIYSCIRKCEAMIKQKVVLKLFQQCQEIEDLKKELLRLTEKYCKYPEECKDEAEMIERIMNKVRDLDIN